MPFYELPDGTIVRCDVIVNMLGVGNRLNNSQLFEIDINFCKQCILYDMKYMETHAEKVNYLFKFLSIISPKQHKKMSKYYDKLNDERKINFIEDIIENGFSIEQPPMYGNVDLDVLDKVYTEFGIEPMDAYVYKWGRKKKLLNKVIIADKYIYKLKHHKIVSGVINSFNCWKYYINKSAA